MTKDLELKSIASGCEVKDPTLGIVEAVVARVGVVDADGDLFLPGAFGKQKVRVSAYNHKSWPHRGGEMPVGRGTIEERADKVIATVQFFMKTSAGREHFEHVKEMAELQEWSYGWPPGGEKRAEVTEEMAAQGIRRAIKGVPVVEVSPVLMGASVGTGTLSVKDNDSTEGGDDLMEPEFREQLEAALQAAEPDAELEVKDVLDETVIYSIEGEDGLFRRAFTVEEKAVTVAGDREEVRRVVEFVPVEPEREEPSLDDEEGQLKEAIAVEVGRFEALRVRQSMP